MGGACSNCRGPGWEAESSQFKPTCGHNLGGVLEVVGDTRRP